MLIPSGLGYRSVATSCEHDNEAMNYLSAEHLTIWAIISSGDLVRDGLDSATSEQRAIAGSYEHNNERWGSMKA
jgi:hypothetical protein